MAHDEEGFSLVEVIIAMFLLMVIALAILPLTIGATRVSVSNRDLAAATTFANAQLAPITAAFPNDSLSPTSCATLRSTYAKTGVVDPAGTGLAATVSIGNCPASYPGSVTVTVTVTQGSTTLVTLPTRVMVTVS